MGINFSFVKEPEPMVLIPPAFTRNLKARNRFSESPFTYLFGETQSQELFAHYYTTPGTATARIDIRPEIYADAGHAVIDFGANVHTGGRHQKQSTVGGARFRFQASEDDQYSFMEITTTNENKGSADVKFCVLHQGFAVFGNGGIAKQGDSAKHASIGVRYSSAKSTLGFRVDSLSADTLTTWAVGSLNALTLGAEAQLVKDTSTVWIKDSTVGISFASTPPESLRPGFLVALQARKNMTEWSLAYHHHLIVNRNVKNPFEDDHIKYITNYIDLGLEMVHRTNVDEGPTINFGASWQINKNCMIKAKIANLSSFETVFAFKSWWNPSFTFALTSSFGGNHNLGTFGLYIGTENFGMVEYERTTAKYVPRTAATKREVSPVTWKEKPEGAQSPEWVQKKTKNDTFL